MYKSESILENEIYKIWNFEIQTDHIIPASRPDHVIVNKKACCLVDFAVFTDLYLHLRCFYHNVLADKFFSFPQIFDTFRSLFPSRLQQENEKWDKYLDLARELKKLCNMNMTLITIVIGALATIPKGLVKRLEELEIGGGAETIQTTALLRSSRILRRVLSLWPQKKTIS